MVVDPQKTENSDRMPTHLQHNHVGISPKLRNAVNGHQAGVLWFTGLPSSGKTTLAQALQRELFELGYQVFVLDGDDIRIRLNSDLGFEPADRTEHIRRVGNVAALFADAGMIVIAACISPYGDDRERARVAAENRFHCVYIQADMDICKQRDPYGLWEKSRRGEIQNFTGVDAPYEVPENPQLIINTVDYSIEECVVQLLDYVKIEFALLSES